MLKTLAIFYNINNPTTHMMANSAKAPMETNLQTSL
jgi:hypothetical protein